MATRLMLDAAYPPPPDQWVADMNTAGADGGFVYVVGPILNYTADHVVVARASGKAVVPIVVPGNDTIPYDSIRAALEAYGFLAGMVVTDLERFSLPPVQWYAGFVQTLHWWNYLAVEYGTPTDTAPYDPGDDQWIATWIRTGVLDPIPSLPPGLDAFQFVNDVNVNGHLYDVSVVNDKFWTEENLGMSVTVGLDPTDATVKAIMDGAGESRSELTLGFQTNPDGSKMGTTANYLSSQFDRIAQLIQQASTPAVDVNALATALAPLLPASVSADVIAQAVVTHLGAAITAGKGA